MQSNKKKKEKKTEALDIKEDRILSTNKITLERYYSILTLFRPGGGGGGGGVRILPAATLDANNFFNIRANGTKFGDFFQNLSGNNLI